MFRKDGENMWTDFLKQIIACTLHLVKRKTVSYS